MKICLFLENADTENHIAPSGSQTMETVRKAAKKSLPPPPSSLMAKQKSDFFFELQKSYFSLDARPLSPSLSGRATKKITVFCGFPYVHKTSPLIPSSPSWLK